MPAPLETRGVSSDATVSRAALDIQICATDAPTDVEAISAPNGGYVGASTMDGRYTK
jgi:hypothetical protein